MHRTLSTARTRWIWTFLLTFLLAGGAAASRRGPAPRVQLGLDRTESFPGEPYAAWILPSANGFVYCYSLDSEGYVTLLYPVLPEDGRGQVQRGDTLWLDPLYAGNEAGPERIVAVHTLEPRPVKASRRHFLAPDPQDLPDIHARLTRMERELDNYATGLLTVLPSVVPAPEEDEEDEGEEYADGGVTIHHHVYDYWCPYCDCWHPACTHDHCWCGWEVVGHYHGWYHSHHCFVWGAWHPWWRPPVVYVYVRGGSPWDYDTRPWRSHEVWGRHRHASQRWRDLERPRLTDPAPFVDPPRRSTLDKPDFVPISRRLHEETRVPARKPSVLSTDPQRELDPSDTPRSRRWSTDGSSDLRREGTPEAAPSSKPAPTTKGKSSKRKKSPSTAPEAKPETKPESPTSKPDKPDKPEKPEAKPDKAPKPAAPVAKPESKPGTPGKTPKR